MMAGGVKEPASISDDMKDIDTYISTNVVWEGWEWCDVQHFHHMG